MASQEVEIVRSRLAPNFEGAATEMAVTAPIRRVSRSLVAAVSSIDPEPESCDLSEPGWIRLGTIRSRPRIDPGQSVFRSYGITGPHPKP